jgi:hypothetical protein
MNNATWFSTLGLGYSSIVLEGLYSFAYDFDFVALKCWKIGSYGVNDSLETEKWDLVNPQLFLIEKQIFGMRIFIHELRAKTFHRSFRFVSVLKGSRNGTICGVLSMTLRKPFQRCNCHCVNHSRFMDTSNVQLTSKSEFDISVTAWIRAQSGADWRNFGLKISYHCPF